MLIHGCKTGSKLGHFPKIANIFNQNGRGQGVVCSNFELQLCCFLILCFKKTLILEARYQNEYKR